MTEAFIDTLSRTGFRETRRTSKVVEYQLGTRHTIYALLQNKQFSLVVGPDHDALLRKFADSAGLTTKDGYYHNIHMNRFPKRVNKGRKPTHFGSKLEFHTSGQLADFLARVIL